MAARAAVAAPSSTAKLLVCALLLPSTCVAWRKVIDNGLLDQLVAAQAKTATSATVQKGDTLLAGGTVATGITKVASAHPEDRPKVAQDAKMEAHAEHKGAKTEAGEEHTFQNMHVSSQVQLGREHTQARTRQASGKFIGASICLVVAACIVVAAIFSQAQTSEAAGDALGVMRATQASQEKQDAQLAKELQELSQQLRARVQKNPSSKVTHFFTGAQDRFVAVVPLPEPTQVVNPKMALERWKFASVMWWDTEEAFNKKAPPKNMIGLSSVVSVQLAGTSGERAGCGDDKRLLVHYHSGKNNRSSADFRDEDDSAPAGTGYEPEILTLGLMFTKTEKSKAFAMAFTSLAGKLQKRFGPSAMPHYEPDVGAAQIGGKIRQTSAGIGPKTMGKTATDMGPKRRPEGGEPLAFGKSQSVPTKNKKTFFGQMGQALFAPATKSQDRSRSSSDEASSGDEFPSTDQVDQSTSWASTAASFHGQQQTKRLPPEDSVRGSHESPRIPHAAAASTEATALY